MQICHHIYFNNWASWNSDGHMVSCIWNEQMNMLIKREEVLTPNRAMGLVVWVHPSWGIRQHDVLSCDGKGQAPCKASGLREFSSSTHWSWNRKSFEVPSPWWMGPCSTFCLWKQIYPEGSKGGDYWKRVNSEVTVLPIIFRRDKDLLKDICSGWSMVSCPALGTQQKIFIFCSEWRIPIYLFFQRLCFAGGAESEHT